MKSKKPERDALDEFINTVPVNIERLIRSQGIKLNTNAKPEDFTASKNQNLRHFGNSEMSKSRGRILNKFLLLLGLI